MVLQIPEGAASAKTAQVSSLPRTDTAQITGLADLATEGTQSFCTSWLPARYHLLLPVGKR